MLRARILSGLTLCVLAVLSLPNAFAEFDVPSTEPSTVRIFNLDNSGKSKGMGTGFIVNDQGYVVTNHHVIDEGSGRVIMFVPGRTGPGGSGGYYGSVRSASSDKDIAIIEIDRSLLTDAEESFPILPLATSEPRKGQSVFALGFPGVADRLSADDQLWDATLTSGIVSRVSETSWTSNGPIMKIVQHDADLNKGNSGGPLFDECGRVLGINTQISLGQVVGSGQVVGASGVNFSSSITEATPMLRSMGVTFQESDANCNAAGELEEVTPAADNEEDEEASDEEDGEINYQYVAIGVGAAAAALLAFFLIANRKPKPVSPLTPAAPAPTSHPSHPSGASSNQASKLKPVAPAPAPAGFDLNLSGFDGGGRAFKIRAAGKLLADPYGVVIGRATEFSDLGLDHPQLSRRHARLFCVEGKCFVEDLNSTNGTKVSGRAIEPFKPVEVAPGKEICLGKLEITIGKG